MARDTRTGRMFEATVVPALTMAGYGYAPQVHVGQRPNNRKHIVDAVVQNNDGTKLLVSLKWQQVGGTAEQKVPFEVICLADILRNREYCRAYIVLGGEGWTLRQYYTSGDLVTRISGAERIDIVTLEGFLAKTAKRQL